MAASFNKVLLMGNLTRDPEMRYIPSGQPVTSFSVAVNRTYAAPSGEKKEEVSYVRVVVWGRSAENCNEYLRKGSSVFVEGRLQSRSWEAQDGSKRSTLEVIAQSVQFLSRPKGSDSGDVPEAADDVFEEPDSPRPAKSSSASSSSDLRPDDEIPF
ncbi:MAG: single-stranded DNA-binding protein [Candidatus Omnitrophica bacterium]|nr:single-stranded DNA-binding protein [Candidatus Omnitrophota bacterium]